MTDNTLWSGLSEITRVILNEGSSKGELQQAAVNYASWLESINPVEKFRFDPVQHLNLPSGKAIDPMSAAHCVFDYSRTVQFIKGLYQAVLAARSRFNAAPVHVFYAGTGPYAALILPLTTIFSPDAVQFTLVEAHPVTYEMLLQTIDKLGVRAWLKKTICGDACHIQPADYEPVHVFLTETMHAALAREPQVAITRHFARQLPSDAIFLPEKIRIWAGLSNPALNNSRIFSTDPTQIFDHELGTLMELTSVSAGNDREDTFPVVTISVPENLRTDYPLLSLYTEITVFGKQIITMGESPLTLPVQIMNFQKTNFAADSIRFQYRIGVDPGFSMVEPML